VTDGSPSTGTLYATASASWTETGVTWNTRPARGAQLAGTTAAPKGTWVEFDVTSIVTGPGQYSFTLVDGVKDLVAFASRESVSPPQLVIGFG
jgi:hypothetical protein